MTVGAPGAAGSNDTPMSAPLATLCGFLNIDKPAGITSFDAVRRIRRAAGVRRVGHSGTLDPIATGVLPVAIGEATKLVDEVMGASKRYRGVITLGVETDTDDAEGQVVARADSSAVTAATIESALGAFRGELLQTPPAYSAVKREGVPAYKAAREGKPHALEPRPVTVHSLTLLDVSASEITVEVECGKGFYMRALAHDLGRALGVGGYLSSLRRTAVGPFVAADSEPLEESAQRLERGELETLLHAPDAVLTGWPALILSPAAAAATRHGRDFRPPPTSLRRAGVAGERARGYGADGRLVALFEATAIPGAWHPYRVFPATRIGAQTDTESHSSV